MSLHVYINSDMMYIPEGEMAGASIRHKHVRIDQTKLDKAKKALQAATEKFIRRFNLLEDELNKRGNKLGDVDLTELDAIWNEIKKR